LHFHRHANDKVLLVCPFSSKQELWFDLKCVNVHDGKQSRMRYCNKANGNIPYNVVFPSQFAQLLIPYQQHPEAKSLDRTEHSTADTHGLLQCTHAIEGEIRYLGNETDRKWKEGDDHEYGRKGKVIASDEVTATIQKIGINKCARESGFDRKTSYGNLCEGFR
jgi:hypothetical protein